MNEQLWDVVAGGGEWDVAGEAGELVCTSTEGEARCTAEVLRQSGLRVRVVPHIEA